MSTWDLLRAPSDGCLDSIRGRGHVFVLPHDDQVPPGVSQALLGVLIPLDIGPELGEPPRPVLPRKRAVLWARVPEASSNFDHYATRTKDDVGSASRSCDHRTIDPETKTTSMEL